MSEYIFRPDRPIKNYRKSDIVFIICVLLLWGLGIYTLYICSAGIGEKFFKDKNYFFKRQLASSVLGFAGMIVFTFLDIRTIRKFAFSFAVFCIALCFIALIPGVGGNRNGASRWIVIPHLISFQPSELVKFSVVLYLAHMFDSHSNEYNESSKDVLFPFFILGLFAAVIFLQRNLSTGIFVIALGIAMFILSGAPIKWIFPVSILVIPLLVLLVLTEEYRLMRVLAFLQPDKFSLTTGYQTSASERAISGGGIWGTGITEGLEKIATIPEIQTDYIFAGWATIMGLFGVTCYFLLLLIFTLRGFKIALNCPNKFASFTAFGCTLSIFAQSIFNCGVVCGVIPTTGIPLPFFSSGGTSLIVTFCMCGFIINASHYDADKDNEQSLKKSYKNNDIESIGGVVVEYE